MILFLFINLQRTFVSLHYTLICILFYILINSIFRENYQPDIGQLSKLSNLADNLANGTLECNNVIVNGTLNVQGKEPILES